MIISVSNIDVDFDTEYNSLVFLLNLLIKLKSPYRNRKALVNIQNFEDRVKLFLENKMLDRTDPDISSLVIKVQTMTSRINELKSQLIL